MSFVVFAAFSCYGHSSENHYSCMKRRGSFVRSFNQIAKNGNNKNSYFAFKRISHSSSKELLKTTDISNRKKICITIKYLLDIKGNFPFEAPF